MFKSDKAKLMYSLIICCCCVTLLTVSLAWFILGANPYEADGAIINTGEITLDAELYFGNDEDKNGVLEIDEEYEPIVGESDREKELGEKYEPMNASDNNVDDCFAMAKLTYRAVVKNNNDFPVKISLSYPKSDDYFISYLESTNLTYTDGNVSEVNSDNWDSIMKEKSARVMFRLKITGCRIYSAADVLIKSTYTEQAQVQSLVLSGETDYFLYDLSETRPFF